MERYLDISRMLSLMRRRDTLKSKYPLHSEKEYKLLCGSMQTLKDVCLRKMIEETINKYNWYCAGLEKGDPSTFGNRVHINNDEVEIVYLPGSYDSEYGVIFKKTGDFGVYRFSVFDDGETRGTYYRCDALFKDRKFLGIA